MGENYYNQICNLLSESPERRFTDRIEIMKLIMDSYTELNESSNNFFRIISIHGIGGIGKSRLVREFESIISPEPLILVSFEISERSNIINNLYKIRKKIPGVCPIFDYALLRYWEMTNPALINDDFMNYFNDSFFSAVLELATEVSNARENSGIANLKMPSIISFSTIKTFINEVIRIVPKFLHSSAFNLVNKASPEKLLTVLAKILGLEIKKKINDYSIEHPIFIFDSYQESQPFSISEEWLKDLIDSIGCGLFIVTSREILHWDTNSTLISVHLDCYPEQAAKDLLEETIEGREDLVEIIIKSTQCIPIYINLSLDIYEQQQDINKDEFIDKILFADRNKLVEIFVSHLCLEYQKVVLDLASIKVFNKEIFEYLSQSRTINISTYEYENLINTNLINYVSKENGTDLFKLHDVFCRDVQRSRNANEFYDIFKTYIKYICYRRDFLFERDKGITLSILFQNIINISIELEEILINKNLQLEIETIEIILDIFFTLSLCKIDFVPKNPDGVKSGKMKKVCQLVYAKIYEKRNTLKTIELLNKIDQPQCFGKHRLSFESILYYAKSLSGQYDEFKDWLDTIESQTSDAVKSEWFYNKIKIYQADYCIMIGEFLKAKESLLLLGNNYLTVEDAYSIDRALGHIQRFNMNLNSAEKTYTELSLKYKDNSVIQEYLDANICETLCYFPKRGFIKYAKSVLRKMVIPYNCKNKAKVLYSLAIASVKERNYKAADRYIKQSIEINKEDGYQSGLLFAYMAKVYLEYSKNGTISNGLRNKINYIIESNKVYSYFQLPLAIIDNNDYQLKVIEESFEWIDYKNTKNVFQQFISDIFSK